MVVPEKDSGSVVVSSAVRGSRMVIMQVGRGRGWGRGDGRLNMGFMHGVHVSETRSEA